MRSGVETAQVIYLSLGSNLGEREGNLRAAIGRLRRRVRIGEVSSLYETDPVGVRDQPSFLNIALAGETVLDPEQLLLFVKDVERDVGRVATYRWGPRVVDVDILLYGNLVLKTPDLIIPHREMAARAFVTVPLAEIAPSVRHPLLQMRVDELRERTPGLESVRRLGSWNNLDEHPVPGSPSS